MLKIWLGWNSRYCPCPPDTAPAQPILPLPTHSVADPNTFQIFFPWQASMYISTKKSRSWFLVVTVTLGRVLFLLIWFQLSLLLLGPFLFVPSPPIIPKSSLWYSNRCYGSRRKFIPWLNYSTSFKLSKGAQEPHQRKHYDTSHTATIELQKFSY